MALFGKKKVIKETEPQEKVVAHKGMKATDISNGKDFSRVLRQPRITEKATMVTERSVYVFEIDPRATKDDVKQAVIVFYKVTPTKINIVRIPSKKISSPRRGVFGRKAGGKKAYVYLKKGETIDIV
ncbi:MAG TPA: 50S ribosomal protein L23 [Candidatus Paceibacterota bacterium]